MFVGMLCIMPIAIFMGMPSSVFEVSNLWIFLGYLLVFLLLMNWNVYVGIGFILITSTLFKMYLPNIKGYIGEKRINKMLQKLGENP